MFNKLVTKVNVIDTSEFILKAQYNTYKSGLKNKINNAGKKIPATSQLVEKRYTMLRSLRLKLKYLVLLAQPLLLLLMLFRIRYRTLAIQSRKQIMMQKYQTLRLNT